MSTEMINCEACGSPMSATDRFCPECGHTNAAAVTASLPPAEDAERPTPETVDEVTSEAPAEVAAYLDAEGADTAEAETPTVAGSAEEGEESAPGETAPNEAIFATPMSPPSFVLEESSGTASMGSIFDTPSNETRRVDTGTYSDTPPTGAPTVNIGQAGYAPPAGWQPGQYGSGQPAPGQQPPYPPYPTGQGQGETPRQPAGQYPPPQPQYAPPPPQPQYNPPPGYAPTQSLGQYGGQPQPPAQGYGQGYPAPPGYRYGTPGTPPRDPTIALLLELIGYAGFLGIGHIYAGRVSRGIGLMVAGWVYMAMSTLLLIILIGCFMWVAWLAIPIASGLWIRSELEKENAGLRYG